MGGNDPTTVGTTYPRGFSPSVDWRWPLVPARDLVTLSYGRSLKADTRVTGKVPVYGTNGQCGWHDASLAKGPGIIVGRKGQGPLGVEWCDTDYWVIDTAYYVSPLAQDLDLKYFYYLVKYIGLNHLKDGTSNPTLSRDSFGSQLLPRPPLFEQRAIAAAVGALDDKIELNRRMNATLEAMARALFQSWFVDFDPVRAKLDDRQPAGLDRATAALFPDSFEDSELGHIPKGWKVTPLSSIAQVVMGTSPSSDTYNETGIGTPLVNGPVEFGDYFPVKTKWTTEPTRFAEAGDLIFCVRGSTTGRRVVSDDNYCLGRGVCSIRANSGWQPFVNQTIEVELPRMLSRATGSVFPSLGAPEMKDFQVLAPTPQLIKEYCRIVAPLQNKIENNVMQSHGIASIRDGLLPKLLSGELTVAELSPA